MKIVYRPVLTGNRRWRKIFPFCTGKILESVPHIAAKGEFDMVDTRGYICPTPVLMVQKALKDRPAMVEVLAEAGAAMENITRFAHSQGYQVSKTAGRTGLETDPDEIKDRRGARRLPACRFSCPAV